MLGKDSYAQAAKNCSDEFRACCGTAGAAAFIENAPHQTKKPDPLKELKKSMLFDKTELELATADPSRGFNILGLFQSLFKRKKESKKERYRRMLKEY